MSANDEQSDTVDATGAMPEATAEKAEQAKFTQSDLDRILNDRLERQKLKILKEVEKSQEDAANEKLEAAAEWQTLAEKRQNLITKHEGRIAELEQQAALVERYGKALDGYVTQLSAGLPEAIIGLLAPMDQAAKLEWLTANRTQFVTDEQTAVPSEPTKAEEQRPLPSTPPAKGSNGISAEERRKRSARTF